MSFTLGYQNVRGLRTKSNEFSSNFLTRNLDFLCLTETWLNSDFISSEYIPNNFRSYRKDRDYSAANTSRGGGSWIIHKAGIDSIRRYDFELNVPFLEDIWIQVKLVDSDNDASLFICLVYFTPKSDNTHLYIKFNDMLKDNLAKLNPFDRLLILGDFNLPLIEWGLAATGDLTPTLSIHCLKSLEIIDLMSYGSLNQFNNVRNCDGRILDLVLSSDPIRAITVSEDVEHIVNPDAYHPPLLINVEANISFLPVLNHRKFKFRKANYAIINNELENTDWNFIETSPFNTAVNQFYKIINDIIQKYTPRYLGSIKHPFWFSNELKKKLRAKQKARVKWKLNGLLVDYQSFSSLRKECKKLIDKCYDDYIISLQSNLKSNIKLFWAFTKSKRKTNSYPSQFKHNNQSASSPNEICEMFSNFFKSTFTNHSSDRSFNINHTANQTTVNPLRILPVDVENTISKLDLNKNGGPDGIPNYFLRMTNKQISIPLSMIFSRSCREATVPPEFKSSFITPIFKKGDESLVTNYRPVAMSNTIALVFEKIMNAHILTAIGDKLTFNQHGFMKNRSTGTNLNEYVSFISGALDEGREVHAGYFDFSKAFDTVDHDRLISKLSEIGLDDSVVKWIGSYLSERTVFVTFNGEKSSSFTPNSGVPQGSVLGPLLFNIFINDLGDKILNCFLLFADDLKIFAKIVSPSSVISLQNDIDYVFKWSTLNNLKLNVDKCQIMKFSNRITPLQTLYFMNNSVLTEVSEINDLGIIFDSKLKFDTHIDAIVKKANSMLGFIFRSTSKFNDKSCIKYLFNAFVRSKLDYNCSVWSPHQTGHKLKLERVQRKYTRILYFKLNLQSTQYTERLKYLNITSLEERREYFDLCLLHNAIHNPIPNTLLRPLFRLDNRPNRLNLVFNPRPIPRTDYGLEVNPIARSQRLFNDSYRELDIMNQTLNAFKKLITTFQLNKQLNY